MATEQQRPPCDQCGKPALVRFPFGDGHLQLCLMCNLAFEQAQAIETQRDYMTLNMLSAEVEAATGLRMARIPIPNLPPMNNLHYTDASGANIGVINNGTIHTITNAAGILRQSGSENIAAAIEQLLIAVRDTPHLAPQVKNEAAERLSFIAEEATKAPELRRGSLINATLVDLAQLLGGIGGLSELWGTYGPVLHSFFQ